MKIKINIPFQGYKKGQVVEVKTNATNVPLDKFWRRRLQDSIVDNCIEVVKEIPAVEITEVQEVVKAVEVATEVSQAVEVLVEKVAEKVSKKTKSA